LRHHALVEQEFLITSAIQSRRQEGITWTLTFTPLRPPPGAHFDPEHNKEIIITLPPGEVDNMTFDTTYTRSELQALSEKGSGGSGTPT
jgi:hypothetical protein